MTAVRYVIYGAGAVGGAIGGRLAQHGRDVALIARGDHGRALATTGLELRSPGETLQLSMSVATHPGELDISSSDVVVLAMKTQDTEAALRELAAGADPGVAVVCAQNGVENERLALRRFANVYGMCVMLPATHLEPGVVEVNSAPITGVLDLGRVPGGVDERSTAIAADLADSQFSSYAIPDVMRWKYRKLVMNLGNSLEAACGSAARGGTLYDLARDEALACFAAAGIDAASVEEDTARRGDLLRLARVGGRRREGGSSWQSLARGTGSIETDHLNGEIVLLGRLTGVPTPVNGMLQMLANRLAERKAPPGSVTFEELEGLLTLDGQAAAGIGGD